MTLPDSHIFVADYAFTRKEEDSEEEEVAEAVCVRRLGWLSKACRLHVKPHLASSWSASPDLKNKSGCCCCFALILLAGFSPSCWLLGRKRWLGMYHRCCHPKISKSFILPPRFTRKFWSECIFGVVSSHLWEMCVAELIYVSFTAEDLYYLLGC